MNLLLLEINGYKPVTPDKDGYAVTENKIWSKNTGRTASGDMVGDIITRKYSIALKWSGMKEEDVAELDKAINTKAFFPVTFINQRGETLARTFYSDDPVYGKKICIDGVMKYSTVNLTLTQK